MGSEKVMLRTNAVAQFSFRSIEEYIMECELFSGIFFLPKVSWFLGFGKNSANQSKKSTCFVNYVDHINCSSPCDDCTMPC